jgi:lipopolysaccharide transport system ATP-binding protein
MSVMIEVRDLGKQYRIGTKAQPADSFREALVGMLQKPFGWFRRSRLEGDEPRGPRSIWALQDINFDVERAETVGIIGPNGAGKSTLLKILSRITEPTRGIARIRGRLSSLLEVGTGFHPDLTGRENIFLNGAILGMRRTEIISKFDEMVEFADIGEFLDTPVKRYSSGMYIRLAFAVAASLNPEILVVDEVLAVGDMAFQKKCLGKMNEVHRGGRTVLFVSHNMAAVENLCARTIWIEGGRIRQNGPTRDVIRAYLSSLSAAEKQALDLTTVRERQGTGQVRFSRLEFLSPDGAELRTVHSGDPLRVRLHYECFRDIPKLEFGLRIFSNLGVLLSDLHTWTTAQAIPLAPRGKGTIDLEIDYLNLMPGTYQIGIWVSSYHEWHDLMDNAAKLEVEPSDYYGTGRGIEARFGLIFLPFRWISSNGAESGPHGSENGRAVKSNSRGNGTAQEAVPCRPSGNGTALSTR